MSSVLIPYLTYLLYLVSNYYCEFCCMEVNGNRLFLIKGLSYYKITEDNLNFSGVVKNQQ